MDTILSVSNISRVYTVRGKCATERGEPMQHAFEEPVRKLCG